MSAMSDALIITGEINHMEEFWCDDLNTGIEEVNRFMGWAVEQHRAAARKDLGIDDVTLNALLQQQISFQVDCMIADENFDSEYRSIALALYRYYLIVYKDTMRNELTFEELEVLDEINKIRLG
jgi:hypothetical protein